MQRVVSFKAEEELVNILDRLAKIMDKHRSELIREALEQYIEQHRDLLETYKPRNTVTEPPRTIVVA